MVPILADVEPLCQEFMDSNVHILLIHLTSDFDPSHNANKQLGTIIAVVAKRCRGDKAIGMGDQIVAKQNIKETFYDHIKWSGII